MEVFCKVKPILSYGFKGFGYLYKRDIKRFYAKYKLNPYPILILENDIEVGVVNDVFIHNSKLYANVLFYKKEDYNKDIQAYFSGLLRGNTGYDKSKKTYPIKIKDISYCKTV